MDFEEREKRKIKTQKIITVAFFGLSIIVVILFFGGMLNSETMNVPRNQLTEPQKTLFFDELNKEYICIDTFDPSTFYPPEDCKGFQFEVGT